MSANIIELGARREARRQEDAAFHAVMGKRLAQQAAISRTVDRLIRRGESIEELIRSLQIVAEVLKHHGSVAL